MVALTTFANAYLNNHPVTFDLNHYTAYTCKGIKFIKTPEVGSLKNRTVLAKDPQSWFDYLMKKKVTCLKLHHSHSSEEISQERSTAAFIGGGGYWFIETAQSDRSDLWESVWEINTSRGASTWNVWYVQSKVKPNEVQNIPSSLKDVRIELSDALRDIISFAEKQDDTKEWISWFQKALLALDSEKDDEIYNTHFPECCYDRNARQLIAASGRAWLFGGMGSWNDVLFGAEEKILREYNMVSNRLYDAICGAIIAAVNSYPE